MLTFEEARTRLLARAKTLGTERLPLSRAARRVLAESVLAPVDLPPFSYSAMDGYALRSESLAGPAPFTVPVVGESRTGRSPEALVPGTAARIFTGAEIPAGADTVIPQEDVEARPGAIALRSAPRPGQHIRRAGEDIARGTAALVRGRLGLHLVRRHERDASIQIQVRNLRIHEHRDASWRGGVQDGRHRVRRDTALQVIGDEHDVRVRSVRGHCCRHACGDGLIEIGIGLEIDARYLLLSLRDDAQLPRRRSSVVGDQVLRDHAPDAEALP